MLQLIIRYTVIFSLLLFSLPAISQTDVTTPSEFFGFNIGDDYKLITYSQFADYWKQLDRESPRMKLVEIGPTAEERKQYMAIITSPDNFARLDHYQGIARKLALAEGLTDEDARELSKEGKAVVWIDGGLHASEVVGSHQLAEMVYQMVSRTDDETMRFLDDVILLAVHANPDGMELISSWYMQEPDREKRTFATIPRLYQKYIGHDNNRDSYMVTQPETENMSRIMYREWFPQIMYNHHQTGPSDIIVFVPPFRDPPNYNYDPLIITGIESVGAAMHGRLIAEGKPGSGMRNASNYSIWFNGNLRTTGYFHNQIGLLTEIKGHPTPMELAFWPDRQLPSTDFPYPHVPGEWHFREAIEYSITMNRAVIDYASRNSETLLFNRYLMGRNNIDKGSRDHWTVWPQTVYAVNREAMKDPANRPMLAQMFRRRGAGISKEYLTMFRKPEDRDPRGFILPADQKDFPTAVAFVNTLLKNGVTVHRATRDFTVSGKEYPKGSLVIKTAQAFRPHVMDMIEPQDHPNDFLYDGGPPIPPYDNAGYTLAFQMGVEFDRILEGFDGPFEVVEGLADPMPGYITNGRGAAGYLLDHAVNNSVIVTNRLLADGRDVFWLKNSVSINGTTYPAGTIYIKAGSSVDRKIGDMAQELGVSFTGVASPPAVDALQLNKVRVGLWDRYGGSMPSGWTRWLMEQFEFPFRLVFPKELNAGNLNDTFDAIVFVTDAIPAGEINLAPRVRSRGRNFDPATIPEEYHDWLGNVTQEKTVPKLIEFMKNGGSVIAIGSSTNIGPLAGLPVSNHIVDGNGNALETEDYYIPSSVMHVRVDNTNPLAYGMKERVDIFFNNSPVFRLKPDADRMGVSTVAWFDSDKPLKSGWAWGQDRLYGGATILSAEIGNGKLHLFGPEILFRAQSHGTFNFYFNGLYLACAKPVSLKQLR